MLANTFHHARDDDNHLASEYLLIPRRCVVDDSALPLIVQLVARGPHRRSGTMIIACHRLYPIAVFRFDNTARGRPAERLEILRWHVFLYTDRVLRFLFGTNKDTG